MPPVRPVLRVALSRGRGLASSPGRRTSSPQATSTRSSVWWAAASVLLIELYPARCCSLELSLLTHFSPVSHSWQTTKRPHGWQNRGWRCLNRYGWHVTDSLCCHCINRCCVCQASFDKKWMLGSRRRRTTLRTWCCATCCSRTPRSPACRCHAPSSPSSSIHSGCPCGDTPLVSDAAPSTLGSHPTQCPMRPQVHRPEEAQLLDEHHRYGAAQAGPHVWPGDEGDRAGIQGGQGQGARCGALLFA